MSELEDIKAKIRGVAPEIEERYGVKLLGLFGSFARGEAKADSDVDVLFSATRRISLFEIVRAKDDLADVLNRDVDLVERESLRERVRQYVENDLVNV